ncbi:MAG: sulfite exporter TauE/SafE family protein [Bernardetiaceae bacterium]|jgi:hypothetical protein|nr:sulfite exporter TauE/SafE family protein [Bernardetiaceae bacterium]
MENIITLRHIGLLIVGLKVALVAFLVSQIDFSQLYLSQNFVWFVVAGFLAQMIDGALGMAYGVSCNTVLLSAGLPPALASAAVHTAEVFTTGASGLSHLYFKNINKRLFLRLALGGMVGAGLGAYALAEVLNGEFMRPLVSAYLVFLGILIIRKSFLPKPLNEKMRFLPALGFTGGFLDSIGGGGWGPIVTSNLINKGNCPKETIGTVNTAEFFITFASSGVFLFFVGIQSWQAVLGLVLGGIVAAPLGAYLVKLVQPKALMRVVGVLVILVSSYNIYKMLG